MSCFLFDFRYSLCWDGDRALELRVIAFVENFLPIVTEPFGVKFCRLLDTDGGGAGVVLVVVCGAKLVYSIECYAR